LDFNNAVKMMESIAFCIWLPVAEEKLTASLFKYSSPLMLRLLQIYVNNKQFIINIWNFSDYSSA
jgi:hypothetical protein